LTSIQPPPKILTQRDAEPGRHHPVFPGDITSDRPGDFVGIRIQARQKRDPGLEAAGNLANVGSENNHKN
jgi:hypothetical protein